MKNNRIKISKSQLGRLVENNVNENSGGVGNLSTDDSPNIGMGSSKLTPNPDKGRLNNTLNIMGGTDPQQFKESDSAGGKFRKFVKGLFKSNERVGKDYIQVTWPSKETQDQYSGKIDSLDLTTNECGGGETGMVCALCYCYGSWALWVNGCPCEEEEEPMDWMDEQESMNEILGKQHPWLRSPEWDRPDQWYDNVAGGGNACAEDKDCEEGECCYTAQCLDCKDVPGEESYDYIPDADTPKDMSLRESVRRKLNENWTQAQGDQICENHYPGTTMSSQDCNYPDYCLITCSGGGQIEIGKETLNTTVDTKRQDDTNDIGGKNRFDDIGQKEIRENVRRNDRDKARRRPYSSKARDMRGSRDMGRMKR